MKFSIVITTYNRQPFLQRAIASALRQQHPAEIVVVDDGSTDGTELYCQSLGDRIRYCRQPQNLGHAASVNRGVELASGDWIKLLDDDDYLAPNCLEVIAQAIARYPTAVICSCQAIQVNAKQRELSRTAKVGQLDMLHIPQSDIHYGMLLEQLPFGTPVQVAFCRDAFLQSGGWDSSLDTNCDDIDSWVRIAQFGDAIFINHCLAYRTLWAHAINRNHAIRQRFAANWLIKQKIYPLVHVRYRPLLPPLTTICRYLMLHWSLVALKQGDLKSGMQLGLPAVGSVSAWRLMVHAIGARWFSRNLQHRQQASCLYPGTTLVDALRSDAVYTDNVNSETAHDQAKT